MKRRSFLKTVGGATGAAAMGVVSAPNTLAQDKRSRGGPRTNALEQVKKPRDSSTKTSTLRVRPPMWHPDGCPPEGKPDENLPKDEKGRWQVFVEEAVGKAKDGYMRSLPVEFDYKGTSNGWILGGPIPEPVAGEKGLTTLIRRLAVKVRKYNASLYRLRRIHYCNNYTSSPDKEHWPPANPNGGDDPDPTLGDVTDRIKTAESNWCTVTEELDNFLEDAKAGYPDASAPLRLVGLDMVEVNGYVISMRVVVKKKGGSDREQVGVLQVDGSSSHVSISSPFSSS